MNIRTIQETISRFALLKCGVLLKRLSISVVFILVTLIVPSLASADDLDNLAKQMQSMEQRHQREMRDLRAQIEALTRQQTSPAITSTAQLQERVSDLEEEVEIIHDDDAGILERMDRAVHMDLYASIFFKDIEGDNSTFDANKLDLVLSGSLSERLSMGAEVEFERTATVDPDSSRSGDIELEQAWLEYYISEGFRPRFGVVLLPFGKFNLNHYEPVRDLSARPIMMRRIIPTSWSDVGFGFSGSKQLKNSFIRYQAYVVNGLTAELTSTSTRSARSAFGKDNNDNKALVGRVALFPDDDLELGFSAYQGKYDNENDATILGLGTDVSYSWKRFEFLGEYAQFDVDDGLLADGVTPAPDEYQGFYLQANYHFWPSSLNDTFLGRGFSNPTFTTSLRYGRAQVRNDGTAAIGDNDEDRWTVGFNYRPIEAYVFKFEYLFNSTENEALEMGGTDGLLISVNAAF